MSRYEDEYFEMLSYEEDGKKKGGKKWVAILVAVVLAVVAVLGVMAFLIKPEENKAEGYLQEGLEKYAEPELRLAEPQGIRFKASVSPELKQEVENDENKSLGMIIAPLNYFLKVDTKDSLAETDWVGRFNEESMTVLYYDNCGINTKVQPNGTVIGHYIQCSITNIFYKNTNLEFMAFAYVKTVDGENESYKYASYPQEYSYKTQARSLAYLTAEALNNKAANNVHYSNADIEIMNGFINNSVDYANGLEEATLDGSKYTVSLSINEKTLKLGEEIQIDVEIAENVKVPIWWKTEAETVASVSNGVVKATGVGTTRIIVYVAGEEYTCAITVTETGEVDLETNSETQESNN